MPDVSVIVVNYRTEALTGRALDAARAAAPGLEIEEIVVDNGATAQTAAALAAHAPRARVIPEPANRGFAAGVNAGVAAARGDRLFILNSDAFCRDDALARLVAHLDAHPRAGLVAPRLTGEDGGLQVNAYRRFPNLVTLFFDFTAPLHLLGHSRLHPHALPPSRFEGPAGPVAHVMGAAMLARRAAYDAAGPLDEGYFLYLEETEWQRRMAGAGWEVHLEPAAHLVHLEHGSSDATVVSPHFLASAVRYHGPRARAVMRAGARISVASARAARRVRPADERFVKLERAFSEVLERLAAAERP